MSQYVFTFSLKDKEKPHIVIGTSVEDDGHIIIVKNANEEIARFRWVEVQGYSRDPKK